MVQVLNGRQLAKNIRSKTKEQIKRQKLDLGMGVILVGDDAPSHLYVGLKKKAAQEVGIRFELEEFPAGVTKEELIEKINEWNARADIHGIMVQIPLPNREDENAIVAAIDPKKDVDGFHPKSIEAYKKGKPSLVPPVHLGIMRLIASAEKVTGKHAAIVSSEFFGLPLIALMKEQGIEGKIVSKDDLYSSDITKKADILVSVIGEAGLITAPIVKPGATVIDIGATKVDGKFVGDVAFEAVEYVAGAISPVPGGSGPMTVAYLMHNVLKAYTLQKN